MIYRVRQENHSATGVLNLMRNRRVADTNPPSNGSGKAGQREIAAAVSALKPVILFA
jgi:hypothetical protein